MDWWQRDHFINRLCTLFYLPKDALGEGYDPFSPQNLEAALWETLLVGFPSDLLHFLLPASLPYSSYWHHHYTCPHSSMCLQRLTRLDNIMVDTNILLEIYGGQNSHSDPESSFWSPLECCSNTEVPATILRGRTNAPTQQLDYNNSIWTVISE